MDYVLQKLYAVTNIQHLLYNYIIAGKDIRSQDFFYKLFWIEASSDDMNSLKRYTEQSGTWDWIYSTVNGSLSTYISI